MTAASTCDSEAATDNLAAASLIIWHIMINFAADLHTRQDQQA